MKKIITIILLIFSASLYAKDPIKTSFDALMHTKEMKNAKKNLKKKTKKYVKRIPSSMILMTQIGVKQEIDFKVNKYNYLNLNYKNKSVSYQYQIGF